MTLSPELEDVLAQSPDVRDSLDEKALKQLEHANPQRAIELVEEIAAKGDVRNPSAFIASSLSKFPHPRGRSGDVDASRPRMSSFAQNSFAPRQDLGGYGAGSSDLDNVLAQYPDVRDALDETALRRLSTANPERAREIVEEVAAKGDVHNPSAFVVKSLNTFPHRRGKVGDLDRTLARHPHLQGMLDEAALAKLQEADPARATEIIEDLAAKDDVRNPSAFISRALQNFPHKRGGAPTDAWQGAPQMQQQHQQHQQQPRFVYQAPTSYISVPQHQQGRPSVGGPAAITGDIRNPSAFVMKALSSFPEKRGSMNHVSIALQRHPGIHGALDEKAMRQLEDADQDRAIEIVEEMAAKGNIRNPSAFIAKSLNTFPMKRGTSAEFALNRYPALRNMLDDQAIAALESANQDRACEIIDDLALKSGGHSAAPSFAPSPVQPSSAPHSFRSGAAPPARFAPAVRQAPHAFQQRAPLQSPRPSSAGRGADGLEGMYPGVFAALDDVAVMKLREADPARAEEILQDVSTKGDIHNPSAFVVKALKTFPHKRAYEDAAPQSFAPAFKAPRVGGLGHGQPGTEYAQTGTALDLLDASARKQLEVADPERAEEILAELEEKGEQVRNASAFVSRALRQFPQARGRMSG